MNVYTKEEGINNSDLTGQYNYSHVPSPGIPIIVKVSPLPVDATILGEEDIAKAVMRHWLHCAGGPSGIKAEHLRMCHRAAKREEDPNPGNWYEVVVLIQAALSGVELATPFP